VKKTASVLCICFDFGTTAQKCPDPLPEVQKIGPCLRATASSFLVKTDLSPDAAVEALSEELIKATKKILAFHVAAACWSLQGDEESDIEDAYAFMDDNVHPFE
jgi:hypothetical protein